MVKNFGSGDVPNFRSGHSERVRFGPWYAGLRSFCEGVTTIRLITAPTWKSPHCRYESLNHERAMADDPCEDLARVCIRGPGGMAESEKSALPLR